MSPPSKTVHLSCRLWVWTHYLWWRGARRLWRNQYHREGRQLRMERPRGLPVFQWLHMRGDWYATGTVPAEGYIIHHCLLSFMAREIFHGIIIQRFWVVITCHVWFKAFCHGWIIKPFLRKVGDSCIMIYHVLIINYKEILKWVVRFLHSSCIS